MRRGVVPAVLGRLDRRLAGAALMAFSVAGGLRVSAGPSPSGLVVLAATRDLPANRPLGPGDLRPVQVQADQEVLDRLVAAPVEEVEGRVPRYPLLRDGLLARDSLADAPSGGREISVPLEEAHAVGGAIGVGDRVDVLASFGGQGSAARTLVVARSAPVVAIGRSSGGLSGLDGGVTSVTLSVSADDAIALAFALRNAELDLVRSTGSTQRGRESVDVDTLGVGAPALGGGSGSVARPSGPPADRPSSRWLDRRAPGCGADGRPEACR